MHDLININKFLNRTIGFEDIFTRFFQMQEYDSVYPFYDIKKVDDENYSLEMALAGWKKSDIKVTVEDGVLTVNGSVEKNTDKYIHKGVAQRAFKKRLQLSEYVECKGARLEDGMLKVELFYNPPENKKAKEIKIK
jgi:Molecular chaperone (small heat shock protein)